LKFYEITLHERLAPPHGQIRTPSVSKAARIEAGVLIRRLQRGERLSMPHSRPMPVIGPRCHELRILDADKTWRIICRIDEDAVVLVDLFAKKTQTTPKSAMDACKRRLASYVKEV
jgi:phage-related protein